MPIPKFEFEDADAGLPRQPVPVRFACMAADWSPALFADLVTGDEQLGPPLLTVWQYDEQNERVGRIPPQAYGDLIPRDARLAEALSGIPANHFVWSDELSIAFSQLIDLTIGREVANEAQLEIRWDTAIDKDCARKVAEGPDFSKIFAPSRKDCYLKKVGGAWITSYDGIETPIKHSIGLVYLQYLLAHPYRDVPVNDLNTCAYPPAGADIQDAADYERAVSMTKCKK